ncbi:MAG: PIN domain-containing protein, partial [Chloroflexota bacterium]
VAGAIVRRTDDTDLGHKVVDHVLSTPNLHLVNLDKELGKLAAQLAAEHRLRGADAIYVAVAHRLQVPLISWDREQVERAKAVIIARTP